MIPLSHVEKKKQTIFINLFSLDRDLYIVFYNFNYILFVKNFSGTDEEPKVSKILIVC